MTEQESIVFVVDDDDSVRNSLRRLIRSVGLEVRVFPSAQAFLAAPRPDAPSCLVLDLSLPGWSGLDLQKHLVESAVPLPIVFLTGRGDIPATVRAMKAGAVEFLTKPFREQELLEAIQQALASARTRRAEQRELDELRLRYDALTAREREVFAGVVAGLLNKQIAAQFGTSEVTVKEQRSRVMTKMRAGSVADLVRFAARLGIESHPTKVG